MAKSGYTNGMAGAGSDANTSLPQTQSFAYCRVVHQRLNGGAAWDSYPNHPKPACDAITTAGVRFGTARITAELHVARCGNGSNRYHNFHHGFCRSFLALAVAAGGAC
jgi:hypothetical protein